MKLSVRTLITVGAVSLAGGLLLGWLFFGGTPEAEHTHAVAGNAETIWTCSMHPQIRQNEPGSCPICGMDLISLDADGGEGIDPMAVSMSPTAIQLANVTTAVVGDRQAVKTIRVNGKVQVDERRLYTQTAHFPGRVEQLAVNFTGEYVTKGSTIANLYAPLLVTAQEELLEAFKIKEQQPKLYQAAREKLKNWKLTETQIDEIIDSGKTNDNFPIKADYSGYVIKKSVNLGDHLREGQPLYEIANLSRVWVLFDAYEADLPWIARGDSVSFEVSSLPGQQFTGTIDYIDPLIDPRTRVAKARVVVSNADQKLKPEMFVTGRVKTELTASENGLTVPKSAVMWTGKRSLVYVKLSTTQGLQFKMRQVTLGPALGDAYLVTEGLEPGEEIAVNGTFSIDAAAQLAGKPSMMAPEGGASMTGHQHGSTSQTGTQTDHAQHEREEQLPLNETDQTYESDAPFRQQLATVFASYLPVKNALVESDLEATHQAAQKLQETVDQVDMRLVGGEAHMEWMKDLEVLDKAITGIMNASDIEKARMMLSPLSDQLYHTLKKFDVPTGGFRQFCPMAFDFEGAFWLSDSEEIRNPYFGDAMLTCGNVEEELK